MCLMEALIESRLAFVCKFLETIICLLFLSRSTLLANLTVLSEDLWPQVAAPHLLAPLAGEAGGSLLSLRLQAGRSAELF